MASKDSSQSHAHSHSHQDEDIISYCGSMSGETFTSRRRRIACSLRQHSIDSLALKLREHSFVDEPSKSPTGPYCTGQPAKSRCNTVFHQYRFLVAMFGGFSVGLMLLLRYNVTVAILKMVNQTALYMEEHPNRTMDDFLAEGYAPGGEFLWDNEIQHMIMSWYMVAYTLPQVASTKLGLVIGSRLAVPISLALCALSSMLVPVVAYYGWEYVIVMRLVNGLGASAVLPLMINLIERWMPYEQMSLGLTCAQIFQTSLTAVNPIIAGYLSSIHWSYAFYVPSLVTLVFCALWLALVTDSPDDSLLVSQKELELICGCQGQRQEAAGASQSNSGITGQLGWRDVVRLPTFYCYIFMWCFYCSSYSAFSFILPTYLRQFLKIHISQNGLFCSMIQAGCILSVLWPHSFLRLLEHKCNLSRTASRRTTYAIICAVTAVTWIYVGTFHDSQLILLFINRAFQPGTDVVVTGNLMGNFAKVGLSSLVFSMVNTIGNFSVVVSSTTIGYYLDYTGQSEFGWRVIYTTMGLAQILMAVTFATTIDSKPIDFAKKPAVVGDSLDTISVVVSKLDGGADRRLDKLRGFSCPASREQESNKSVA